MSFFTHQVDIFTHLNLARTFTKSIYMRILFCRNSTSILKFINISITGLKIIKVTNRYLDHLVTTTNTSTRRILKITNNSINRYLDHLVTTTNTSTRRRRVAIYQIAKELIQTEGLFSNVHTKYVGPIWRCTWRTYLLISVARNLSCSPKTTYLFYQITWAKVTR
jgi:hypothetical protein